jgi:hypothetical protein
MDRLAGNRGAWIAALPLGPRIAFAPENDLGSPPVPPAPLADPELKADPAVPPAVTRPEGIADEYWDDAGKTVKFAELTGKLNELTAFKAEQDSRLASRPEKPEGYEVKLPEDFKLPDGFVLPEGEKLQLNADDPRVAAGREYVHAMGGNQADFEKLCGLVVGMDIQEQIALDKAQKAEVEKLGSRGAERSAAATAWLKAKGAGALTIALFRADQIEAVEKLMSANRHDTLGRPGAERDGKPSGVPEGFENMNFRQKMAATFASAKN